jgi:hypothetical protein
MQARVKNDSRYNRVVLFSGCEFVKTEWRPVPAESESDALVSDWLEIQKIPVYAKEAQPDSGRVIEIAPVTSQHRNRRNKP